MTSYETWSLVLGGLNLIPAYIVASGVSYGIYVMDKNAKQRAEDSQRKHDESMTALKTLIERTSKAQ